MFGTIDMLPIAMEASSAKRTVVVLSWVKLWFLNRKSLYLTLGRWVRKLDLLEELLLLNLNVGSLGLDPTILN